MMNKPDEGYQLSLQQKHIWRLQRSGRSYRSRCAILIKGQLDVRLLKETVARMIERHEMLRTTFHETPEMLFPVQVVNESTHFNWREINLRHLEKCEWRAWIKKYFEEAGESDIDFASGSLVHLTLLNVSTDQHALLIDLPALCADAQTLNNIFDEIGKSYTALRRGEQFSQETMQYVDFCEWQHELVSGADEEVTNFWRQRASSLFEDLKLPFETHLELHLRGEPRSAILTIDVDARSQAEMLAGRCETTIPACLLACWQVLLWRFTKETETTAGVGFDGRKYDELQKAVGLFAKRLPIQTHLESTLTFVDVVEQVKESIRNAHRWQEYFSLEETLGPAQGTMIPPPYSIGFDYEDQAATYVDDTGLTFSIEQQESCLDRCKVKLRSISAGEMLRFEFWYDPDLLEVEYVEQMGRCFVALLESASQEPQTAIEALSLIGNHDRRRLLEEFNETSASYPADQSFIQLFEAQVERTPDKIAVVFEEQRLSYAELNSQANQLASYLRRRGAGPNTLIGLCVGRSLEMIVGLMGILKAGAGYVPLDPELPKERLAHQIAEIQSPVLIVEKKYLNHLPPAKVEIFVLDGDRALLANEPSTNPPAAASSQDIAYVIYTSGSTGVPKGVVITNQNLVNYTSFICHQLGSNTRRAGLTFATVSTLAADLGNTSIFPSLASGGCLHIISYEVATDANLFARYNSEHAIDVLKIVPAHLRGLLPASASGHEALPRTCLILGGETFSFDLLRQLEELKPECEIINHYGPTEATIGAALLHVKDLARRTASSASVPIGRPIANTEIYILDDLGAPVPVGIPGELQIAGDGVAQGYLNQPEQTAEKFIPNPFSPFAERMYRTGDLARYLPDGNIEYLGRIDQQVKIRGFRVELGEIEAALGRHADVRDSVVVAREDAVGDKSLTAYVVVKQLPKDSVVDGEEPLYLLPNGMRVAQQNKHETDFFYRQIFVEQSNLKYGMTLPDNACVFDVGANIGLFTLYVQQQCRNAAIYSFEPSPRIFNLLRQNATRYGVDAHLFECGLSSESKVVPFTFYPEESCMSGFYGDKGYEKATLKSIMVGQFKSEAGKLIPQANELEELVDERTRSESLSCQLRTLSEIVAQEKIECIDLLKIDVEKSELDVLAGIKEDDWKKIRQLVIEAHDLDGRVQRISDLLRSRSYDVHIEQDALLNGTDLFNIYAVRLPAKDTVANGAATAVSQSLPPYHRNSVSTGELTSFLETQLPHYMIPSTFVLMDSLPLTRNGKIDRRTLPLPDNKHNRAANKYVAPRNYVEEVLARVWSQVLRVERVGIDDNFFALGGDSIRSIQIRYRAQKEDLELRARDFFALPTIRQLSEVTRHEVLPASSAVGGESFSLISAEDRSRLPIDIVDAYPLAMLQAGMIFHSEYSAGSTTYLDIIGYHIRCRYDFDALQLAVNQLVKRHNVLRTSFDQDNYNEPLQLVHRETTVTVEVEDLSHLSVAEQARELAEWMERAKCRKFDLSRSPLLRVTVHLRSADTFQLTLCHHHAILDGWSNSSLTTELLQRYLYLMDHRPYFEQPLKSVYRDFVALERATLESDEHRHFWEERLRESSVMTLPRWSAPSLNVDGRLRRLHVPISIELSEQLKEAGLLIGVPLKSVLLAVHFKVMSLLAGQEDILTGVVAHGRSELPDGDLILGLYLNSVPFRRKLTSGSWLELAQGLFEDEQELQPFQSYPLAEIQRRCGGQPLFETLFNFSHFHVFNDLIGQEGIEFLGVESFEETNFTLLANFTTDLLPSKVRLDLSYDANALSDELVTTIGSYYARTLEAIAADPAADYATFTPLSFAERKQLLGSWNDTGSASPNDKCLHQLFEEQVKQFPDQLALVFEDEQLTYRELNERANQMARYLQTLGVRTESHVGIYLQRSLDMAIAVLAVLKAGGTYIPIDPEYPQERVFYILNDAKLQVLLTQQSLLHTLPLRSAPVVCVDSWRKSIALQSSDDLNPFVLPDNLAYITYTSGSTGQPKGVALPQRALTNLVEWHLSGLAGGVRTLQFAPLGFDLSFYEMFVTWLSGGTLYLMREELRRDVPGLARFLLKHKIQKVVLPVVLLQELAEECEAQDMVLVDLLEVISSGEQLHITKAVMEFFEKLPGCKLHNHYGPSETHAATAYELDDDPTTWGTHPSIGRPISATQIYLLDRYLNPVPVGVAGELYIGGTCLARGYLNRPDLTAEKFVPNPFGEKGGGRLYRTGDHARYATNGNIEFLGRVDHQIKIRGYRVELGEIEAVLGQHPDISEVVVIAHTSLKSGEKSLVAYVVPEQVTTSVESPAVVDLRAFLNNKLPGYMVPSAFVILKSLPLTPNNKIDYRALAAMDHSREEPAGIFAPARTPTEEIIAGIWSEVLGLERVGIHDNFLELGGHSLKATQIASRIRSSFQIELPLHCIFKYSTVAALAAQLDGAGRTEAMLTSPVRIADDGGALPLSFGQQRLWFLSQLKSNSAFYNVPGAVRLMGELDVAALDRSLNEVVRRHAVLRTTFKLIEGSPVQMIAPDSNLMLPVIDLSELPVLDREAEVQRIATSEAKRLFDLATGPLLRVSLLRCSSEDHVLVMVLHHIVSDGWSRGVLVRELTALYQTFSCGKQPDLSELPIQYADFAVWQREWFSGDVLQRQLHYWKEALDRAPGVMSLPVDRLRPAIQTFRSGKLTVALPESLSAALRRLSRREGVTLFMTLLAAFETLLYRYSGESDVVIGTTIANRRWQEIEGLIGFFTNSLVLRTDLSGNPSFRELLKRVRKVTLGAYAHQDLPFEKLVEELNIERKLSHTPLFQVVFSFQNSPAPEVDLPHLLVTPMEIDSGAAMFDLILGMVDTGQELTGVLLYSTDLFEAATAAKLFDDLTLLLEEVVVHPERLLLDLELDRTRVSVPPIPALLRAGYEVEQFEF